MNKIAGFLNEFYKKDYQYGNPEKASKKIEASLDKFIKDVEDSLKMAGQFLAPGIEKKLKEELNKRMKNLKHK